MFSRRESLKTVLALAASAVRGGRREFLLPARAGYGPADTGCGTEYQTRPGGGADPDGHWNHM